MASAGVLPRRQMLESEAHLREGQAQLVKASSRREVLDAQAQLKRAQAAVEAAQSHLRLSDTAYQTRLSQLGTRPNEKGLVTVTAPISGTVSDREVTLGQAFEDAGGVAIALGSFWLGRRSKRSAERLVYETSNSSSSPNGSAKLPESFIVKYCEFPILAESDRHHCENNRHH